MLQSKLGAFYIRPSCNLQEAAAAIAGETRQSDAHPDLMHRDVCTASALRRTYRVSPQQDVATAVVRSAAVVPAYEEDLPRSPFEDRPGLGEALAIDRKHPLGAIRKRPVEFTSGWASHLRSADNVSDLGRSVPIENPAQIYRSLPECDIQPSCMSVFA